MIYLNQKKTKEDKNMMRKGTYNPIGLTTVYTETKKENYKRVEKTEKNYYNNKERNTKKY